MLLKEFYNIIDKEINVLVDKYQDDENIKRHRENKIEQRKAYAFLIWFLEFYGQKLLYKNYITDGTNDFSCDIIFSNTDNQNKTIFYVVQSKWIKLSSNKEIDCIDSDEFGKSLTDFSTILSGNKKNTQNEKFNKKYTELLEHLEKNGLVKFVFFTLAQYNQAIEDTKNSFNKNYAPNISLEIIDITRIRRDYIEFKFKQIFTENPLEYNYNPEDNIIELPIERSDSTDESNEHSDKKSYLNKRDFLEFEGREKAYIFLIKPKTIYDLFEKYKFNLFFKNVRNPIHDSNYNKKIVETLNKKPRSFWYFNNGVTAITRVIPKVGIHAKNLTINGLQIINGAQTVYSVYQAYKNANERDRKIMDSDARITLRLIRSSDEDFNLEITRYTNSQNPLFDRDFVANHEVQQRLQNESFNTKIWYEKRSDEFRLKEFNPEGLDVRIVSNDAMIIAYVAFYLQNPIDVILKQQLFFVSYKENQEGLYEQIFNEKIKYIDILASYYLWELLLKTFGNTIKKSMPIASSVMDTFIPALALSNTTLTKYLKLRFPNPNKDINLSLYIKTAFESDDNEKQMLFIKALRYSFKKIYLKITNDDKIQGKESILKLLTSPIFYQNLRDEIENNGFSLNDVDSQNIDDLEKILHEIEKKKIKNA